MTLEIISVHPTKIIVRSGQAQFEIPTTWFPTRPSAGQTWEISLNRQLHEHEKVDQLNRHLRRN